LELGIFQKGPFEFRINEKIIENSEEKVYLPLRNIYRKIKGKVKLHSWIGLEEIKSQTVNSTETRKKLKKESKSSLVFFVILPIILILFYFLIKFFF
jgi:hypothetical protein